MSVRTDEELLIGFASETLLHHLLSHFMLIHTLNLFKCFRILMINISVTKTQAGQTSITWTIKVDIGKIKTANVCDLYMC